jgi:DNA helicase II / ATP-dependent DNA helicase PcrA
MSTGTRVNKDLLARLNDAQADAVSLGWGPALIIAGAGSGKTTALTRRIAYLIAELKQDPESILAVTFTNKAAGEMKGRVETIVGHNLARRITIGTFHSICARLLRREINQFETEEGWRWSSNFVIYDETDSLNVLKAQIGKLNLDEKVFAPKEIRHTISSIKNDGLTAHRYSEKAKTYREARIAEIYNNYQGEMARSNALDFDDLILVFNELVGRNPSVNARLSEQFRHVLVDEFQDTNKSQYDLVRNIACPSAAQASENTGSAQSAAPKMRAGLPALPVGALHAVPELWPERSLMVVGDVDQSIYSWRKADFRIILGFQQDFPESRLIKLEENYRSTSTILEVANSIIANNTERIEKVLRCNRGKGSKVQCYEGADEIDEAYYVVEELKRQKARGNNFSDCVILYRTNAQSRAVEEILVRSHIPYTMVGATRFYERQEIKDVLAYLKLIYNERDGQAFLRVVNVPRRGIGKTTLERLIAHTENTHVSLTQAAAEAENIADISAKSAKTLRDFSSQIGRWQMLSKATAISSLMDLVLKETGYIEKLEEDANSSRDELALGRIDNVRELINVAKEFESIADEPDLDSFLTRISLVSDLDSLELDQDAVKMMTLHSAKGLEFPIVFLMGLEEGLFPHIRSYDAPAAMEEERRLMYVGVTRAADQLFMTFARRRMMLGRNPSSSGYFSTNYTIPSRFLKEISPGLLAGYYPSPSGNEGSEAVISRQRTTDDSWDDGQFSKKQSLKSAPDEESSPERPSLRKADNAPTQVIRSGSRIRPSDVQSFSQAEAFEHLKVGDVVQHSKFGVGEVTAIIGEQDKELYNIEFKGSGKRLLDPRYAKLIKISSS